MAQLTAIQKLTDVLFHELCTRSVVGDSQALHSGSVRYSPTLSGVCLILRVARKTAASRASFCIRGQKAGCR